MCCVLCGVFLCYGVLVVCSPCGWSTSFSFIASEASTWYFFFLFSCVFPDAMRGGVFSLTALTHLLVAGVDGTTCVLCRVLLVCMCVPSRALDGRECRRDETHTKFN